MLPALESNLHGPGHRTEIRSVPLPVTQYLPHRINHLRLSALRRLLSLNRAPYQRLIAKPEPRPSPIGTTLNPIRNRCQNRSMRCPSETSEKRKWRIRGHPQTIPRLSICRNGINRTRKYCFAGPRRPRISRSTNGQSLVSNRWCQSLGRGRDDHR